MFNTIKSGDSGPWKLLQYCSICLGMSGAKNRNALGTFKGFLAANTAWLLGSPPPRWCWGESFLSTPFEPGGSKILTDFLPEPLQDALGRNQEVDEVAQAIPAVELFHHIKNLPEDCGWCDFKGRIKHGGCSPCSHPATKNPTKRMRVSRASNWVSQATITKSNCGTSSFLQTSSSPKHSSCSASAERSASPEWQQTAYTAKTFLTE